MTEHKEMIEIAEEAVKSLALFEPLKYSLGDLEEALQYLIDIANRVDDVEGILTTNCFNYTGIPCSECEEYSGCLHRAKAISTYLKEGSAENLSIKNKNSDASLPSTYLKTGGRGE